jgi:hypothetical protein
LGIPDYLVTALALAAHQARTRRTFGVGFVNTEKGRTVVGLPSYMEVMGCDGH